MPTKYIDRALMYEMLLNATTAESTTMTKPARQSGTAKNPVVLEVFISVPLNIRYSFANHST